MPFCGNSKRLLAVTYFSKTLDFNSFVFYQGFLSQKLTGHRTAGKGGGTIFYCTLPLRRPHENPDIYLQLCMWDDYQTCVYQTATRWDLRPYWITIWLTDWWCNVCLLDDLILGLLRQFDAVNRWIWTRIDYQTCFTSEPTNQVC